MACVEHQRGVVAQELVGAVRAIHVEQVLPLGPLRFVGGDFGVEGGVHVAECYAVLRIHHELALLPEHLLKALYLRQEVDNLAAHALYEAHQLEPTGGGPFAGGLQVVQVQDLVLQVEVELAVEEAGQILVDEEVGVVAAGVLAQVVFQVGHGLVLAVAPAFAGERGQGVRGVVQPLRNPINGGGDYLVLLLLLTIADAFLRGKRPVLERDGDGAGGLVPFRIVEHWQEEAPVALVVVPLQVGVPQPEVDGDAVGRVPVVVAEVRLGLDVVLVAVGPVQVDLFAVVGDGVALVAPVAALGDEIAVLVVAAEEGVQVVVDGRLGRVSAVRARGGGPCFQVALKYRPGRIRIRPQLTIRADGVVTPVFQNAASQLLNAVGSLVLLGQRPGAQCGVDGGGQLLGDEPLHDVALVVHDAVDAEIEVGAVELEQLAQQVLELGHGVALGGVGRHGV